MSIIIRYITRKLVCIATIIVMFLVATVSISCSVDGVPSERTQEQFEDDMII